MEAEIRECDKKPPDSVLGEKFQMTRMSLQYSKTTGKSPSIFKTKKFVEFYLVYSGVCLEHLGLLLQ